MKYFITTMLLITLSFAKAQIVNIPDSNFLNTLIAAGVDTNNDGFIQNSEAAAQVQLTIGLFTDNNPNRLVRDMTGIKAFINLENLSTVTFNRNLMADLDVAGMIKLKNVKAFSNAFTGLHAAGCTALNSVNVIENNIVAVDISGCINLEYLNVSQNILLPGITFTDNRKLKIFNCNDTRMNNLDLQQCDSLEMLEINDCTTQTVNVNVSGLRKLRTISLIGTRLNALIARNCINLVAIDFVSPTTGIGSLLDVTGCTNLKKVNIPESGMEVLDFSSCPNLEEVNLTINGRIKYINLKNGSALSWFQAGAESLRNICADEFEIASLRGFLAYYPQLPMPNISSYCSFFPGGNYNTISGKTKLDMANNGCDNTDPGMPSVALKITDTSGNSLIRYTAPSGDYAHYPYKGLFTLRPYFPYPYFNINPASATVAFDTANNLTATRDFCIQPNGIHNDLEISFLPSWPPARPGFDASYVLVYKNRGTTTLSGNVQVNFDNGKMNFVNASSPVTTQSTGQLTWNYNNLQPFESKTVQVTFNLLPPPINNINDTLTYLAAITPNTADETPYDNSFILPQRIIGSYDPNDKQCLEGSKLNISKIGDYLHYQIRFQNEGTDTAFNIVVADTLSNKYDWNSFEYLGSSHSADVKLTNNKLEFIFQNIKLPHKAINEPASHGWVAFKIKPKASVVVGDSLNNKAAIYFDFNFPIITNTATTVVTNTSAPVPVKLEYFSVANNNNGHLLQWKATCSNGNANFSIESSTDGIHFSSIGNINTTVLRCQLPLSFTNSNPPAGKIFYRLKITDADGVAFYSKILVVGNTKVGIDITAVTNNIVYLNSSKQQTIQLKVMAADGKQILAQQQTVITGNNNINLSMKHAAKGIYTLIIYNQEGAIITRRFLK